jgi:protein CpxP
MKKKFVLFLTIALAGVITVNAQGGGQGRGRSTEERVKQVMDKFADFKLDKAKSDQVDSTFSQYFRAQGKVREEMMAGGGQVDRQAMQAKMQPLMTERDDKLKKILDADQFKKWKDEIEPALRPQRQGGGGNGNN